MHSLNNEVIMDSTIIHSDKSFCEHLSLWNNELNERSALSTQTHTSCSKKLFLYGIVSPLQSIVAILALPILASIAALMTVGLLIGGICLRDCQYLKAGIALMPAVILSTAAFALRLIPVVGFYLQKPLTTLAQPLWNCVNTTLASC